MNAFKDLEIHCQIAFQNICINIHSHQQHTSLAALAYPSIVNLNLSKLGSKKPVNLNLNKLGNKKLINAF